MTAASLGRGVRMAAGDEAIAPFVPVLERLRAGAPVLFGTADVDLVPTRVETRDHSALLRVAVRHPGAHRPATHLFVKRFSIRPLHDAAQMAARIVHDFETTSRIHQAMSAWPDLGAVRAVVCYPELLAMVTEEATGDTLGAFLRARARWFPAAGRLEATAEVLATVGRWVRVFQAMDDEPGEMSLDGLRDYVDIRLRRLVDQPLARFGEADRSQVLGYIDVMAGRVARGDRVETIVHADLAPGNVLVSGQRVVVLDFAMAKRGSLWQDVSRLYVQLDLMRAKPQFRPHVIGRLQQALLRGFDPGLTDDRPLFRLLLLRHHVNHLTTLSVRPEPFPASLYSAHIRRVHRRWIGRETAGAPGPHA
jgi:hypothetical protein